MHFQRIAELSRGVALAFLCKQSTKAVQAARRSGPPPEHWSWNILTPIVPESSSLISRTHADIRHDETRNQAGALDQNGSQGFADDSYDGDAARLEGDEGLRSQSISPIEHRESSDDDGDSRPPSSSDSARLPNISPACAALHASDYVTV